MKSLVDATEKYPHLNMIFVFFNFEGLITMFISVSVAIGTFVLIENIRFELFTLVLPHDFYTNSNPSLISNSERTSLVPRMSRLLRLDTCLGSGPSLRLRLAYDLIRL